MQNLKSGKNWRDWTRREWNEQLFVHFFFDHDGEDNPVYRIPLTPDELMKVVSDSDADAHEIEKAFLSVVRTPTHRDFNHRLTQYDILSKAVLRGKEIPPYFCELAFSCLVASPPNVEIRSQGDFRKRLASLLKHELPAAGYPPYPLTHLPNLWKSLEVLFQMA